MESIRKIRHLKETRDDVGEGGEGRNAMGWVVAGGGQK